MEAEEPLGGQPVVGEQDPIVARAPAVVGDDEHRVGLVCVDQAPEVPVGGLVDPGDGAAPPGRLPRIVTRMGWIEVLPEEVVCPVGGLEVDQQQVEGARPGQLRDEPRSSFERLHELSFRRVEVAAASLGRGVGEDPVVRRQPAELVQCAPRIHGPLVEPGGVHARDHHAVHRFRRERGRDVHDGHGRSRIRRVRPHRGGHPQPVVARRWQHEVEDAVAARAGPGRERGPGHGAVVRIRRSHRCEGAVRAHGRQVGHQTLGHPASHQVERGPVEPHYERPGHGAKG